jgi:hypothetical protein
MHRFFSAPKTLIVLLGFLLLLHAVAEYNGPAIPSRGGDAEVYFRMAEAPFVFQAAPQGYRVLIPTLVHFLPVSVGMGFILVSTLLIFLTLLLLHAYLRTFEFTRAEAASGVLIGAGSFMTWYSIDNYTLVDGLTYLTLIGSFWAIRRERHVLFWIFVLVGTLNKEVALFVLPLYFFRLFRLADDRPDFSWSRVALRGAASLFLSAVLLVVLVRASHEFVAWIWGPDFSYHGHLTKEAILTILRERVLSPDFVKGVIALFTVFWPFILFNLAFRENRRFLLFHLPYVAGVCGLVFLATETARMLIYLFPVLIPVALNGISPLKSLERLPRALAVAAVLLAGFMLVPRIQSMLFFGPGGGALEAVLVAAALGLVAFSWRYPARKTAAPPEPRPLLP